ncbi:hypothetical protein D7D52_34125 [Nocardia yunnanensis]|uniref:Uncharacterized protein n=1 Tax=Nocardia yunnanensis TaxID=2382165 RepID=A0A386ZN82_9NOCA|nr:hypothetical protein [Nocardia yunnanensis]AYF78025.1 hypothetical protein D7D52_34125 [Nocardia yunnanensis]
MDPNAALTRIRELLKASDDLGYVEGSDQNPAVGMLFHLIDAVEGLDQWLSQGGFLPKEWARTAVTS